jgi:transcriptional regulator with XRE-family HTH domain
MTDKKFRAEYIKAKLGVLVPAQIRGLRLKSNNPPMPRQKDLASEMETQQSRISMFESPGANVTLDTLADIASALRCGLVVKFVPFNKMLNWENGFSQDTFDVTRIENDEEFINPPSPAAEATIIAIPEEKPADTTWPEDAAVVMLGKPPAHIFAPPSRETQMKWLSELINKGNDAISAAQKWSLLGGIATPIPSGKRKPVQRDITGFGLADGTGG